MPAATPTTRKRKPDEQSTSSPGPAPVPAETQTPEAQQQTAPQPQAVTVDDLIRRLEAAQVRDRQGEQDVTAALAAPFAVTEIKFKPQAVSGNRALAVPFVDARTIQDRLDNVLGVMGWQDSYECLPDGSVVCRLKIRIGGEWLTKEDVGGQSEQPDEGDRRKAAFSDALKRAAVKFGIGRYLYRQDLKWVDYDAQKRRFTGQLPILTGSPPRQAAQQQERPAAAAAKPQQTPAQKPAAATTETAAAPEWHVKLRDLDERTAADGRCRPGELVKHVAAQGKHHGYPADFGEWDEKMIAAAREWTTAEQKRFRLRQDADVLMEQKGNPPVADVLTKVRASSSQTFYTLTCEQYEVAIARLQELPDRKKAS